VSGHAKAAEKLNRHCVAKTQSSLPGFDPAIHADYRDAKTDGIVR
jgi:hypothetical protein